MSGAASKGSAKAKAFQELSQQELLTLYFEFTRYRDAGCGGMARMGINEFYRTNGDGHESEDSTRDC